MWSGTRPQKCAKRTVCEGALKCEEYAGGKVPGERAKAAAGPALVKSAQTRWDEKGGVCVNGFGQMRDQGQRVGV